MDRPRSDTFVSLLTPDGRGAIAVVRVTGSDAVALADSLFLPYRGARLGATAPGRLRLGRLGAGHGDEVVAVVLDEQPPGVEIHCHGGHAAVELVIAAFEQAGARRSEPSLLAQTSSDATLAAEAGLDLCRAPTLLSAEILLEQSQGALRDALLAAVGLIDGDPAPAPAVAALDTLLARSAIGLRLLSGWKVVISGRPNVGKSRLLNALVGFARAIVDPTPGTTRDVVTVSVALGGWPIELADTAGLRPTGDFIELEGIARSRRHQREADLVLIVVDRSQPIHPFELEAASAHRAIVVANKADLPAAWDLRDLTVGPCPKLSVSAERGDGMSALCAAIVEILVPGPPGAGDAVPFRPRHVEILKRARELVIAGDPLAAKRLLGSLAT
jgi:tRNA modification GTPase